MSPLAGPLFAAAVVLAVAGAVKVLDPAGTRVALRTVGLPSSAMAARVVGTGEVVIAAAALAVGGTGPAIAVAVAYAGFAAFAERLRRRSRGRADCGCFGRSSAPVSSLHIWVNLVVAAIAALTLFDPVPHLLDAARDTPWSGAPFVGLVVLLSWQLVMVLTVLARVRAAVDRSIQGRRSVVAP